MDGFDPGRDGGGCREMGGGACESYAMWREHHYWNHMRDDKKQFLVVASHDFRHSMSIPQEVGSHLRNMLSESEPVELEAPNGRKYLVVVRKEFGNVVLRSGWSEFVKAHHIEENDSILFMYRGNSSFKVHMFSSTGHEKFLSCYQPSCGISGAVPPFTPCDQPMSNEQVVPNPGHVISTDFDYIMLPGCHLTNALDKKILEIAHAMRSKIPLYVVAMSKSNVSLKSCYVYIPLRLVDNFSEEITKATVQLEAPNKKTYSVVASKRSDDLVVIESGWSVVVASLRIQENDLLIFIRKGTSRMEVLILDPSGCEKISSCSAMGSRSLSAQVIDLTGSDDDDIVKESWRAHKQVAHSYAKKQKMASTSSPFTKSGPGGRKPHDRASVKLEVGSEPRYNNIGESSQQPYILSRQTTLPWKVKRKIEEKVQAIGSELTVFVKVMTSTCVKQKVCIMDFCVEYASAYLQDKTQPLILQLEGERKLWHSTLSVAGCNWKRAFHGWKEFAEDNQLKVGDISLFQLVSCGTGGSLTMTVHLIRESEAQM